MEACGVGLLVVGLVAMGYVSVVALMKDLALWSGVVILWAPWFGLGQIWYARRRRLAKLAYLDTVDPDVP